MKDCCKNLVFTAEENYCTVCGTLHKRDSYGLTSYEYYLKRQKTLLDKITQTEFFYEARQLRQMGETCTSYNKFTLNTVKAYDESKFIISFIAQGIKQCTASDSLSTDSKEPGKLSSFTLNELNDYDIKTMSTDDSQIFRLSAEQVIKLVKKELSLNNKYKKITKEKYTHQIARAKQLVKIINSFDDEDVFTDKLNKIKG